MLFLLLLLFLGGGGSRSRSRRRGSSGLVKGRRRRYDLIELNRWMDGGNVAILIPMVR